MSITRGVVLAPLFFAVACAGNPAPAGFLPSPAEAVRDVYGGWIEVTVTAGRHDSTIAGELIAARADTVWILPDSGPVVVVPTSTVKRGRVARYSPQTGAIAGYTALGVVSTISNGYLLGITAPLWIITGIVSSSSESRAPLLGVPPLPWTDLAAYARFPQGLPPGIDLGEIRPKLGAGTAPSSNP
jgi:hypothetical protein